MVNVNALADNGAAPARPPGPYESNDEPRAKGKLDELAFARWKELGITPARPCSDGVFVRRVFLDILGILPSAREARAFLDDRSPDKRSKLIEAVLGRPEYADYWALHWGDVLRIKSEFPINLWPNAVQAYHRWVYDALQRNVPYDRFVRELLTSSGSNFRTPQVNFYRAVQNRDPESLARAVALTFMGARAEKWPRKRLQGMACFFQHVAYKGTGEWKEEIVHFDPTVRSAGLKGIKPTFPDGRSATAASGADPRIAFVDWLLAPGNPWMARCAVNRLWSWLFGRGIIHEADDIRPDNPPSNPALLSWLERQYAVLKWDTRAMLSLILNSATYQLASIPRTGHPKAEAVFAYYPIRRLEAEVLIDAVNHITGSTETYSSAIPEPYTFVPENQRTVSLADGSIGSSFLDLFGRPARDTGLLAERNSSPTAAQQLHMLNSSHIQQKIARSMQIRSLLASNRQPPALADTLYLTILSRYPTDAEREIVVPLLRSQRSAQDGGLTLAWALINTAEFQYRH